MDVTEQYLATLTKYGGSEYTGPDSLVGSNSIVYAQGPSMQRAIEQTVTTVPFEINYQGDIGLMGTENIFFKINLDIKDTGASINCFEELNWECVKVSDDNGIQDCAKDNEGNIYCYENATIDTDAPEGDEPLYAAARFTNELPFTDGDTLIGVRLTNEGTGNIYEDKNVDSMLYSKCRFEHGFDDMLVSLRGYFYVGIHARNTKRNAYNVKCKVGTAFKRPEELNSDEKKLLAYCP
jgi:hypothetical protein